MRYVPEELRELERKFHPYLEEQKDGTYEFKPGTPEEIRKLRPEFMRRFTKWQIEECCW